MKSRLPHPVGVDPGPSIRSVPFTSMISGKVPARLTDRQREDLLRIATKLRLPARTVIYREGAEANWVFIDGSGVVKTCRELPSGKRRIASFIFPRDVFGLSENGLYLNSAYTITSTL